jgi:ParB family transcriptional regulator, chromosome partitioning protein
MAETAECTGSALSQKGAIIMNIIELPVSQLKEAPWNANQMDETTERKLKESLRNFGLVQPLVVRNIGNSSYEVLSGNHRLKLLQELNFTSVPCIVVDLNDAGAMLLAETLNNLHGEDDLSLKGSLLEKILADIPQDKVLSILPETANSLQALSSLGQSDLAQHLKAWEESRSARLKHLQLQLTIPQLEVIEEAIKIAMPEVKKLGLKSFNQRSTAVFLICKSYIEGVNDHE